MKYLFAIYIVFLLATWGFSYLFIDPNFFYLHNFFSNFYQIHRLTTTIIFVVLILLYFLFYLLFLKFIQNKKLGNKNFIYILILTVFVFLFSYPAMLSFDIFNYIATAKVTYFYHENPYIIMPIEFLHDSILRFMHAANKVALYAPFWILITAIPFLFGFGNFLLILFNFKLLSILFYFATVLLIWKMTKSLYKTAFFALNPLVIIETLISGHNDISMIFLLLLAIYFLQEKKFGKGAIFYIFSAGIKYATLILLPLIPIALVKKWDTKKLFTWITILMAIIFVLSSFREEIYPWYGQWVILPGTFLIDNKLIKYILVGLSFGLLLRYIPFMLLGTYFGPTPILKLILMTIPILVAFFFYTIKKQKMYEGH